MLSMGRSPGPPDKLIFETMTCSMTTSRYLMGALSVFPSERKQDTVTFGTCFPLQQSFRRSSVAESMYFEKLKFWWLACSTVPAPAALRVGDPRWVGPGLSRDFRHVHSSFPQRELGLELLAGVVLRENVVSDPAIQIRRNVIGSHEASDFVSHDRLQIMGESRGRQDIGEHGRDPGIRVGLVGVVLSRLLGRLAREERRVVRALAMTQGGETQGVEPVFPPIARGGLGLAR